MSRLRSSVSRDATTYSQNRPSTPSTVQQNIHHTTTHHPKTTSRLFSHYTVMCQGTQIAWRCKCSNKKCPLSTDNSLGHLLYYQESIAFFWCDYWFHSPDFDFSLAVPLCPLIEYDIDERHKPQICDGCVNCPQSEWGDTWLPSRNRSRIPDEDKERIKKEKEMKRFEKWRAEKRKKQAETAIGESVGLRLAQEHTPETNRGRSSTRASEQCERSSSTDSVRSDVTVIPATSSSHEDPQVPGATPRRIQILPGSSRTRARSSALSAHSHSESEDETEEQLRKPRGRALTRALASLKPADSLRHSAARIGAWKSSWKQVMGNEQD